MHALRSRFSWHLFMWRARRVLQLVLFALVVLFALGLWALYASSEHFMAFGAAPSGLHLGRVRASTHFIGGRFENLEPTVLMQPGTLWSSALQWLSGDEMRVPSCPLPIVADTAARLETHSTSGLRVTWLGHSTTLIEIDGAVILTDPMWSERASPSTWLGPKRFVPPPLAIADLPRIDAVLISHEHLVKLPGRFPRGVFPVGRFPRNAARERGRVR